MSGSAWNRFLSNVISCSRPRRHGELNANYEHFLCAPKLRTSGEIWRIRLYCERTFRANKLRTLYSLFAADAEANKSLKTARDLADIEIGKFEVLCSKILVVRVVAVLIA